MNRVLITQGIHKPQIRFLIIRQGKKMEAKTQARHAPGKAGEEKSLNQYPRLRSDAGGRGGSGGGSGSQGKKCVGVTDEARR